MPLSWYYESNGLVRGPVTLPQLKQLLETNAIAPMDSVWQDDPCAKKPASSVLGIFEEIPSVPVEPASKESTRVSPEEPAQIPVVCAKCGFQFRVARQFAGRHGRCPIDRCRQVFVVPTSAVSNDNPSGLTPTSNRVASKPTRSVTRRLARLLIQVMGATTLVITIAAVAAWMWLPMSVNDWAEQFGVSWLLKEDDPSGQDRFQVEASPILQKYCSNCHSGKDSQGNFLLDKYHDERSVLKFHRKWERVTQLITAGVMPPSGESAPDDHEREALLDYLESTLYPNRLNQASRHEGVSLRRLNRREYNNTVRDLFGVDFHPADDFPSDDVGHGFDNIGQILSLSPLLMEKYFSAAEKIAGQLISLDNCQDDTSRQFIVWSCPDGTKPVDCALEHLREFLPKAFRRPVDEREIDRFVSLVSQAIQRGESFRFGMRTALTAALVSPQFLFRAAGPSTGRSRHERQLGQYELASKLSYFLWSSMPDDELFQHASRGDLHTESVLATQVKRMLKDPRASELADSFATQWLHLRILDDFQPAAGKFTEFDATIKSEFKQETRSFFQHVAGEDRSILDFLDGPYTFANSHLAGFYGLADVEGDQFQKISLEGTPRAGLLTQGSILALTSTPNRTSPVKRGKWILEVILDLPPAPPPPNVPELSHTEKQSPELTLREQLEIHRSNPSCAVCHQAMDAIGFGLENFDPVGRWRASDGHHPIDASGTLPGGTSFRGPAELIAVLKQRDRDFAKALTRKLLTYALGRRLDVKDRRVVDAIVKSLQAEDYRFSALINGIVTSRPFHSQGGEGSET